MNGDATPTAARELRPTFDELGANVVGHLVAGVVLVLVWAVIALPPLFGWFALPIFAWIDGGVMFAAAMAVLTAGALLLAQVVTGLFAANYLRASLREVDGGPAVVPGDLVRDLGSAVPTFVTVAILAVVLTVGLGMCVLPGLVLAVLALYAPFLVADGREGPFAAFATSAREVFAAPGDPVLAVALLTALWVVAGSIPVAGPIVAAPLTVLYAARVYRATHPVEAQAGDRASE